MDLEKQNDTRPIDGGNGAADGPEAAGGISLGDISLTLFRHKWLILGFVCLGSVAAAAIRFVRPPTFVSWAKVMVLYVENGPGLGPPDPDRPKMAIDANAINTEIELLKTADVAFKVADLIGPEQILAKRGGGTNREAAAGVIYSGIEVENPKGTAILTISFHHRDKALVQPILNALLTTYMEHTREARRGGKGLDDYYKHQSDELNAKLAATEQELKKIRTNVLVGASIEETKRALQVELMKYQELVRNAQVELATRQAVIGDVSSGAVTNAAGQLVSPEQITDYTDTLKDLEGAKRNERVLSQKFKPLMPVLQTTRAQIEELSQHKANLELEFPALAKFAANLVREGTNSAAADLDEIRRLIARIASLGIVISNIQAEASLVMDLEPQVVELTRQRNQDETNAMFFSTAVRRAIVERELGAGAGTMSEVQAPTPPDLDRKKLLKMMGGVFGACAACGLGLAFLMDFVLRRTIRRAADIERHMRLPVFLSIPDTAWGGRPRLPWDGADGRDGRTDNETSASEPGPVEMPIAVWRSGHELQTYVAGLRERLMTYFEVNDLNQKKPKLVAMTGCGHGSGVSTLSSGLAAALSETGTGNVLLVDMTSQGGNAQSFFKGKPGAALADALEPDQRGGAKVKENLYLAKMEESSNGTNNDKLSRALPAGFGHLVPALKASDYDYIIFDMPPVTPTSSTPRLASHMDLVLMVVESEKTGQQLATRSSALLRASRAKVAAVLNKYRQHVPAALSQEP